MSRHAVLVVYCNVRQIGHAVMKLCMQQSDVAKLAELYNPKQELLRQSFGLEKQESAQIRKLRAELGATLVYPGAKLRHP